MISTTTESPNSEIDAKNVDISISGCRRRNRPVTVFMNSGGFDPVCHSSGFGGHIATFGYRSLSQSLVDTYRARRVDNSGFAVGISPVSVIIPEI